MGKNSYISSKAILRKILMTKISKGTLLKSSRNENVLFTFGYLNDRFFLILEPKYHGKTLNMFIRAYLSNLFQFLIANVKQC